MFVRIMGTLGVICFASTAQAQLYPQRMVNVPQQPRTVVQQKPMNAIPFQVKAQTQHHQPQTQQLSQPFQPQPVMQAPTQNGYVYQPVPAPVASLSTYVPNQPVAEVNATPVAAPAAPAPKTRTSQKDDRGFSGSVEGGINFSTGNNESRSANLAAELAFDTFGWKHILTGRLINSEENNLQTEEEYRAGLESRYKLSDVDYLFGEVDAVKDRFSGYDFRITEILGYGRHWHDDEAFKWSSAVGAGFQHAKTIDGERSDDPLGRIRNELFWQILDSLSFENTLEVDVSGFTTVFSSSSFKNNLTENLFLKLGMDNEYISDVPDGVNELDTDIYLNVAYEY